MSGIDMFEQQLGNGLRALAASMPAPTTNPAAARFRTRKRQSRGTTFALRTLRGSLTTAALAAACLGIITRSADPGVWGHHINTAAAICRDDLAHGNVSGCISAVVHNQATTPATSSPSPTPTPTPATASPSATPVGHILFQDTFDQDAPGAAPSGWLGGSSYIVTLDGDAHVARSSASQAFMVAGSTAWRDYAVEVSAQPLTPSSTVGVIARFTSTADFYACVLNGTELHLKHVVHGKAEALIQTRAAAAVQGQWTTLRFEVHGDQMSCSEGTAVVHWQASTSSGRIAVITIGAAEVDTVTVYRL